MQMINWVRVNELRDEIGSEDFDEVAEMFLEEVDEVIERLRTTPDSTKYEQDLHFIKGSAMNLGFQTLGDLCQTGEKQAAIGETDGVDLGAIFAAYDNSKSEFAAQQASYRSAA